VPQSNTQGSARTSWRGRRRRILMGLSTVLGFRQRGFFIPYRYADQLPGRAERPGYAALESVFKAGEAAFAEHLAAIDGFAAELEAIGSEPPPAPRWKQGWFPRLDAAAAYAMVRVKQPKRVVEIGSGHSTRFLARAVADGGLATRITAIDPAPRADIATLETVDLIRTTVQHAGPEPFAALEPGDILSIDSSHILMPGSDVDLLLNGILPGLPDGLILHVHDIFLPDDYPPHWDWRGYNEQLGVAPLLTGDGFDLLWSSHYAATRMAGAVNATVAGRLPIMDDALEASVWLRKGAGS